MKKLAMVYGPALLNYSFGEEHPFSPRRAELSWELLQSVGALEHNDLLLLPPQSASDLDLKLFHTERYLDFVKSSCERGLGFLDGGDTPAVKGGFEAAKTVVGSSWQVVKAVAEGQARAGMTLVGGLHHAHPDQASGFCVFNDIAVCIRRLRRDFGFERIAYIDIDAHHGDGVMYGFYDDPQLLTIDFHEDGRFLFPGTGRLDEVGRGMASGTKFNIPMPPHSGDASFIPTFESLLPAALQLFRPDFILLEAGVDAHQSDPLSDLNYSAASYLHALRLVRQMAEEYCAGRLVLFGGGGYNPLNCALRWTQMAACLLDMELPSTLPLQWRNYYTKITGESLLLDFREEFTQDTQGERVRQLIYWFMKKGWLI